MITLQVKHQEILQMGNAVLVGELLAKTQKTPQLVTKIGECFKLLLIE